MSNSDIHRSVSKSINLKIFCEKNANTLVELGQSD